MTHEYKGFAIIRRGRKVEVYVMGACIRVCRTIKEAKARIDSQTI